MTKERKDASRGYFCCLFRAGPWIFLWSVFLILAEYFFPLRKLLSLVIRCRIFREGECEYFPRMHQRSSLLMDCRFRDSHAGRHYRRWIRCNLFRTSQCQNIMFFFRFLSWFCIVHCAIHPLSLRKVFVKTRLVGRPTFSQGVMESGIHWYSIRKVTLFATSVRLPLPFFAFYFCLFVRACEYEKTGQKEVRIT